jgi:preprotein translocase subunit SecA
MVNTLLLQHWNQKLQNFFKGRKKSHKRLKILHKIVEKINALEPSMQGMSDAELGYKTQEFKSRVRAGESLDALLAEAFAVVREASWRTLGMRQFDSQLLGGIVLHKGMIAEMKTGEGKTLVSAAPVYLNALLEQGVHVVTVNDYLVRRDADTLRPLFEFLEMSIGCVTTDMPSYEKFDAYRADITYGTNNEFGFDFLRDNMKTRAEDQVQRGHCFAIVDEVDSILIDEARTPLIISGPSEDSSELYHAVDQVIAQLTPEHYEKDEKNKNISFTELGWEAVERMMAECDLVKEGALFHAENTSLVHHLNQSLKARFMFERDVDYMVHQGEVIIVDEFTGRMKKGSRYSDGLHQALEAKEGVDIEPENQTLASITFQNYFLMYTKLSGMTGTAETEAAEFQETYSLPVVVIPTNRPVIRKDMEDEVFCTLPGKIKAVVALVKSCQERGQPVLVGTSSIEKSELFSRAFHAADIQHHVLNARQHEQEAGIIARAGFPEAVTIATNMAGRGTDIQLGGSLSNELALRLKEVEDPEARKRIEQEVRQEIEVRKAAVISAGGLYVVGTERHESRRIDNQLRGRSGRQGDPGASQFFISCDDDLMRIFGPRIEVLKRYFLKQNPADDIPVKDRWITRAIETAQGKVEAQNFERRKQLLKYAQILNEQRKAVYATRNDLLHGKAEERFEDIQDSLIHAFVSYYIDPRKLPDFWEIDQLRESIKTVFHVDLDLASWIEQDVMSPDILEERLLESIQSAYEEKKSDLKPDLLLQLIQTILLQKLDSEWTKHLNLMSHLREGIHLRSYGQRDPLNEYKKEAFTLFKNMILRWQENALTRFYAIDNDHFLSQLHRMEEDFDEEDETGGQALLEGEDHDALVLKQGEKLGAPAASIALSTPRNAPCPCGSGERYKHCHGKL